MLCTSSNATASHPVRRADHQQTLPGISTRPALFPLDALLETRRIPEDLLRENPFRRSAQLRSGKRCH
jgi:hypothetical protein